MRWSLHCDGIRLLRSGELDAEAHIVVQKWVGGSALSLNQEKPYQKDEVKKQGAKNCQSGPVALKWDGVGRPSSHMPEAFLIVTNTAETLTKHRVLTSGLETSRTS